MKKLPLILVAALFAGCWTFNETAYPEVAVEAASEAAQARTIRLDGFEASITHYTTVNGYRTVYVPGYHGRYHCEPGYYEVVPTIEYVPQLLTTDIFLRRAEDQFERAGYTLNKIGSSRTVEVRFAGPFVTIGDDWKRVAWNVLTAFFCDYASTRWTATLRIRDTQTGKLLFHHDYTQEFETSSVGLLPLFCASANDHLSSSHMQSWCLAALTDRAVADATAFLKNEQ